MLVASLIVIGTFVTQLITEDSFLVHFCALRNTLKLRKEFRDPYMRRVEFLDSFKMWAGLGGCLAHLRAL